MKPRWGHKRSALSNKGGVVAAQHWLAAEAGAQALTRGGNAIDAAITAAFCLGVLEPWLSGIGGSGYLLYYSAKDRQVTGVDFGTVAPRGLDPERYEIEDGNDGGWFSWPKIKDDLNLKGYDSITVPSAVAGFALALEKFGRLSWRDAISPAIAFAEEGMPIDWFASLCVAIEAEGLEKFGASKEVFLPGGRPPTIGGRHGVNRLPFKSLAKTLEQLSREGCRDFYEGGIAREILADLQANGSAMSQRDLSQYQARLVDPIMFDYRGSRLYAMPGLTGGPSFIDAMQRASHTIDAGGDLNSKAVVAQVTAIRGAFESRLNGLGHKDGCTSHVSVIDAEGNIASLSNSLLSRFGSNVVLPRTGILMNNGMMWFDPRPGRPNSISPGARPLANMCPVVVTKQDKPL